MKQNFIKVPICKSLPPEMTHKDKKIKLEDAAVVVRDAGDKSFLSVVSPAAQHLQYISE